jgi:hypothetical protein
VEPEKPAGGTARPDAAEVDEKILRFFKQIAENQLKERDGHPAMRVIRAKGKPPTLETYIAAGATRLTGMHIKKQGHIQELAGDMIRTADSYHTGSPQIQKGKIASRTTGKKRDMNYFQADQPKDVLGTWAEIRAWFAEHARYRMVIPQPEKDEWDAIDDIHSNTADGYNGTSTLTAEVRVLSWAKKGDKGYVDLGGLRTGLVKAVENSVMLVGGAAAGGLGSEGTASHTVMDVGSAISDGVEQAKHLAGKKPVQPGPFKWNRAAAEQFLEFAVSLHEGEALGGRGEATASHTWRPTERQIVVHGGKEVAWPAIHLGRIGQTVVDELIPEVLDKLERTARR